VCDVQLLCPMNRGALGARSLNLHPQQALNPSPPDKIEKFGWTFANGDKVMQIENDYDKEVYTAMSAMLPGLTGRRVSSRSLSMIAPLCIVSAISTWWSWPMPPRFTKPRARNIRRS
jgi:hypothetical protein